MMASLPKPQRRSKAPVVVDLTDDVPELINDFVDLTAEEEAEAIIDLTTKIDDVEAATPPPENLEYPIPEGSDSIPSHNLKGWTFKPGHGVELEDDDIIRNQRGSRDCFRIVYILRNRQTGKICYKGYRLSCANQKAKVRKFLPRW